MLKLTGKPGSGTVAQVLTLPRDVGLVMAKGSYSCYVQEDRGTAQLLYYSRGLSPVMAFRVLVVDWQDRGTVGGFTSSC